MTKDNNTDNFNSNSATIREPMILYNNDKKSAIIAYLLWFFLGLFGAHRFYLKSYILATIALVCTLSSYLIFPLFLLNIFETFCLSSILIIAILIYLFDLFYLPTILRNYNLTLADSVNCNSEDKYQILKNSLNFNILSNIFISIFLFSIGYLLCTIQNIPKFTILAALDGVIEASINDINTVVADSNL